MNDPREKKKKRSEHRQRVKRVHLRLLPREDTRLRKNAEAVPMMTGDYLRARIMGTPIRCKRVHPKPFLRSYYGAANNLNQLELRLRSGQLCPDEALDRLMRIASDAMEAVDIFADE